jgi:hypothetical protein
VDHIPNDGAEAKRRRLCDADARYVATSIRLELGDDAIRVSFEEGFDGLFESLGVFDRPIDLGASLA